MTGPHGRPYLRMFSRLHDTSGEPLWPGFRLTATTDVRQSRVRCRR
ncbi:MAG: hypothetical protein ACR2HC_02215 [Thermoleophilaceae bacterium]